MQPETTLQQQRTLSRASTSSVWWQSSRVGDIMSARVPSPRWIGGVMLIKSCSIGSRKQSVFPSQKLLKNSN